LLQIIKVLGLPVTQFPTENMVVQISGHNSILDTTSWANTLGNGTICL